MAIAVAATTASPLLQMTPLEVEKAAVSATPALAGIPREASATRRVDGSGTTVVEETRETGTLSLASALLDLEVAMGRETREEDSGEIIPWIFQRNKLTPRKKNAHHCILEDEVVAAAEAVGNASRARLTSKTEALPASAARASGPPALQTRPPRRSHRVSGMAALAVPVASVKVRPASGSFYAQSCKLIHLIQLEGVVCAQCQQCIIDWFRQF